MPPATPTATPQGTNVPVGVGTIAGLGSGGSALVLAVIAFISGDRSQETVAGLASGAFLIAVTVLGRMLQAKALATPNVVNVIERESSARADPGPAYRPPAAAALFDQTDIDGGPRHSEAVSEHDRAIEGPEYDTLVSPKDEERDIHEAV